MKKLYALSAGILALAALSVGAAHLAASATGPDKAPKFPPGVPAAVQNLHFDLEDTAPTGYVTFNMPSGTFDGTPMSSDDRCSYSIEVNGELVKDKTAWWWCDEASLELSAEGHGQAFTVTVWATNDEGDGPKTTISGYIGEDTPAPVSDFTMTITDTQFELSWAPTAGIHGGNYDKGQVKYTLYAYPGARKINSYGPTVSAATVPIDGTLLAGEYYFGLEMEYWDVDKWGSDVYPMAYSNREIVNPYEAPFTFDITANSADAAKMFNIFDANTEENTATWTISSAGAAVSYDGSAPKDDWLFSMPVKLSASDVYRLSLTASDKGYPEILEVFAGQESSVDAMTISVIPKTDLIDGKDVTLTGEFGVETDGIYFIGFHACSTPNQYDLTIKNFGIEVAYSLSAPAAVEALTAEGYYFHESPEARISFRAPVRNIKGDELTALDKVVIRRDGETVSEVTPVAPGEIVEIFDACGTGSFTYSIAAVADGKEGMATEAAVKVTRMFGDDFTYDFSDMAEAKEIFTVIDANKDDYTWQFPSGGPKVLYNQDGTTAMDDWLMSMPLALYGGKVYTFTVNLTNGGGYPEIVELLLGSAPTAEAMTVRVAAPEEYDGAHVISGTFECHTDGIFYLGIHGCSEADKNYIQLRKMQVQPTGECEKFTTEHNLAVKSVAVPEGIAGKPVTVDVTVANTGIKAMGAYTVALFVDDTEVDSAQGSALPSGSTETLTLTFNSTIFHTAAMELRAEITAEDDEVAEDNVSDTYSLQLSESSLPRVTDLSAEKDGSSVILTWTAPSTEGTGFSKVTESFESYPGFSTGMPDSEVEGDNLGDWTVIDGDGLECYVLNGAKAPNYSGTTCSPRAWMIMDTSVPEANAAGLMKAATGVKDIVCLGGRPSGGVSQNDDWLISPLLPGHAQTVSFKAHCAQSDYAESFEVLASSTGKAIDDFTKIDERKISGDEYIDCSYDLPEGTRYFAIRCVTADGYALVIDDITYEVSGGADSELKILGYNVYRNTGLLTPEPVEATEFVEQNVESGQHDYHVNAVYDRGFSALSNVATVLMDQTGLDEVATPEGVTVTARGGAITVTASESTPVQLFTLEGRLIASDTAAPQATFAAETGIYIVRTASSTVKVIVR